ncbi:CoA-transferase [Alsobacter soli]|nr:CoA-transferase [Alsobacter soli]
MTSGSKLASLAEAVSRVPDGACVAIGGHDGRRSPMALICEIIRQGCTGLRLVGWDGGFAFDLLEAAGCAASVETGPAVRDRIRAAALGWTAAPSGAGAPSLALRPDVVLLHGEWADSVGDVRFPVETWEPESPDLLLAQAGASVIASVEQIVSAEAITRRATDPCLPGATIACVAEAPYGAYPTACETRYEVAEQALAEAVAAIRAPETLDAWLDAHVFGPADHWSALDRIGARRLLGVTRDRVLRV